MIRAFQWDLARQVERLDVLLGLLPKYASWGYTELYLHLEDAVDYPSLPGVARADAYSWRELTRLVAAASKVGIGVVPIVNLLGHTQYLIKFPEWRDLNELRAPDGSPLPAGQLCPLHARVPELVEKLLHDTAPLCTAGKLHVGLDESFHLGKCPRCAAEVKKHGLARHFASHATRLHGAVTAKGLRMGLWADMLAFLPEAIPLLPKGAIAYDWYYYPFGKRPRLEFHNFRDYDLAPALRRAGIEYWGCPMNGAFRFEPLPVFGDRLDNIRSWWRRCQRVKAAGLLVTCWEAYRLAFELPVVVDAAAASFWLGEKSASNAALLRRGFERVLEKKSAPAAARAALRADEYPFSGYFAWETHQRWDGGLTLEPPKRLEKVCRHFEKLLSTPLPEPLAASLALRLYFARRDLFIRNAADTVTRLRRGQPPLPPLLAATRSCHAFLEAWQEGDTASQRMWERTRHPSRKAQNRLLLRKDLERLVAWLDWLKAVGRNPSKAAEASPVFGKWRLSFEVLNFEPAVQRVVVEVQEADGAWTEVAGRHTIEFQAAAAARRSDIARPFAVSLEGPERPVRIVVKGVGRVRIKELKLSNGFGGNVVEKLGSGTFTLGPKAPASGFPQV